MRPQGLLRPCAGAPLREGLRASILLTRDTFLLPYDNVHHPDHLEVYGSSLVHSHCAAIVTRHHGGCHLPKIKCCCHWTLSPSSAPASPASAIMVLFSESVSVRTLETSYQWTHNYLVTPARFHQYQFAQVHLYCGIFQTTSLVKAR